MSTTDLTRPGAGITAQQMRDAGKLLTIGEVRERLQPDDGTIHLPLAMGGVTRFAFEEGWFVNLDGKQEDSLVNAWVVTRNPAQGSEKPDGEWHEFRGSWSLSGDGACQYDGCGQQRDNVAHSRTHGEELGVQMTKACALEVCAAVGLPKTYVVKTPARFINPQLDYWYDSPDRQSKLFIVGGVARGVAKATMQPFSNIRLLNRAVRAIQERYGVEESQIFVDKKMSHSLKSTNLLLVIPEATRAMRPGDDWSGGVQLKNSLTGDHPTVVNSYLFRWWCTNGAITKGAGTGAYSRRGAASQREEVYDWIGRSVEESLSALEGEFDRIQAMTTEPIEGEVRAAIDNIASRYKLSSVIREAIANEMMETPDVTMYGLMNAVTRAAQSRGLSNALREQLMGIGGDFVYGAGRCDSCHSVLVDGEERGGHDHD